jgi:hypothetical protein
MSWVLVDQRVASKAATAARMKSRIAVNSPVVAIFRNGDPSADSTARSRA